MEIQISYKARPSAFQGLWLFFMIANRKNLQALTKYCNECVLCMTVHCNGEVERSELTVSVGGRSVSSLNVS